MPEFLSLLQPLGRYATKAFLYFEMTSVRRIVFVSLGVLMVIAVHRGVWHYLEVQHNEQLRLKEAAAEYHKVEAISSSAIDKLELCERSYRTNSSLTTVYCPDAINDALMALGGSGYEMRAKELLKDNGYPMVAIFIKDNLKQIKIDAEAKANNAFETGFRALLDKKPLSLGFGIWLVFFPYSVMYFRYRLNKKTSWSDSV